MQDIFALFLERVRPRKALYTMLSLDIIMLVMENY